MVNHRTVGGAALAAIVGALVMIGWMRPEWLDESHPFLRQEGILEQFQWPCYAAGFVVIASALWRSRAAGRDGLRWLLFLYALLCVRELDIDRTLWLERWYNPTEYLGNADIPVVGQVVMGGVFVAAVAVLVQLVRRHRASLATWWRSRDVRVAMALIVAALTCFVVALLCDKYSTLRRHTGIDLSGPYRMYVEEALEMVGAFLFLLAAFEVAFQERRASAAPSQDAAAPSG